MSDLHVRTEGRIGRVTLARPQALNALTHAMVREIDAALAGWEDDDTVALVLLDGEGPRAFCAGGDIAEVYASGRRGDFAAGAAFWADEYRMNARIAGYPKPRVALMHGFVMGGGVGVGGHASHRVVGTTTRVAMPECAIGLVPDIGGSALLAAAPGRLGEYLGLTGHRMDAGDAIRAGFADSFVPEDRWPGLVSALLDGADPDEAIAAFAEPAPEAALAADADAIDDAFEGADLAAIAARLETTDWGHGVLRTLRRLCPLSMACTLALVRAARRDPGVAKALVREYRFTARAASAGEFLEGVRAAVIDKDRSPQWRDDMDSLRPEEVARMLAPLDEELSLPEALAGARGS
jgi:enoyl-CoA hydratase